MRRPGATVSSLGRNGLTHLQTTLDFLRDLAQNNNRPWFAAHRARYEQAMGAFEALIADVIDAVGRQEDLGSLMPRDCIFRIYRDLRFSKDKTPYKLHFGAVVGAAGRHFPDRGTYIHLQPGDASFIADGLHEPDREQLANVRRAIAEDPQALREILADPEFVRWFGEMRGEMLRTAPQGYDREHPAIDLLRYKQFLVIRPLTDAEVVSDGLVTQIVGARQAMQPFLAWLYESARAG